ncbi:YeeE/YedE family protein [Sphingobacterium sp. DK4209]|uniref:YeeE/YedE family protein n=1 Tax=Sphingobacterium zhuxiongii TaxID=2662364 RepID=A0A5Q0QAH1_9SPHI|nr:MULTISPECIES: DUF6691 family protein [unclassified Sphingobacterium]MVZ64788.1 YeeE/YedE family protein [Sphingobacterium sp. DK4209]QGA27117.1 YeeE/YedE family protein [Sphingobacterium sp. dk4302]
MRKLLFIILGVLFGVVMYKAEAASWFRIYEMFNFQSFHMYGFIGTALVVGVIAVQIIKRTQAKDIDGEKIQIADKAKSIPRYLIGGILFGLGWALVGACPGPLFVLLGAGVYSILIVIVFALIGTYLYGLLRHKLPH